MPTIPRIILGTRRQAQRKAKRFRADLLETRDVAWAIHRDDDVELARDMVIITDEPKAAVPGTSSGKRRYGGCPIRPPSTSVAVDATRNP